MVSTQLEPLAETSGTLSTPFAETLKALLIRIVIIRELDFLGWFDVWGLGFRSLFTRCLCSGMDEGVAMLAYKG